MNGTNHGWDMGFGWIIALIAFVVIVWLIINYINHKNNLNILNKRAPLDVLKKRYIRGKIGTKEFVKKRSQIL